MTRRYRTASQRSGPHWHPRCSCLPRLWSTERTRRLRNGYRRHRPPRLLGGYMVGVADKGGNITMQFLQRRLVSINHVAGLIELVLDIGLELSRHRQLPHLVDPPIKWGCQIEIAGVYLNLQLRVVFHRPGQIGHNAGVPQRPEKVRWLMLRIPYRPEGDHRLVNFVAAIFQYFADILVECRHIG